MQEAPGIPDGNTADSGVSRWFKRKQGFNEPFRAMKQLRVTSNIHKGLCERVAQWAAQWAVSASNRLRSVAHLQSSDSGSIATRWRIARSPP